MDTGDVQKVIEKRGDKWVVIHCHGKDKGKILGSFDTEKEAIAQHRAIELHKNKMLNVKKLFNF